MSVTRSIYHRIQRYRTLQTHHIKTLPVVILMPHSSCNCRCVMCDIWKDNKNLRQLTEADIESLLTSLISLGTKKVLMSGGEALLNPNFFRFCEMLNKEGIKISLLSAGLTISQHAESICEHVHDLVISLDGDEATHNEIRNIPKAFQKLQQGIAELKKINPRYPVAGRCVIHRLNFRKWPQIIDAAKSLQLDSISFLPADVGSHAFNREILWSEQRQQDIMPAETDLPELAAIIDQLTGQYQQDFHSGFIAESPDKLRNIHTYYMALYGYNAFPYKKCNAPWVSTVVEADGTVRSCFFQPALGNIRQQDLAAILNAKESVAFRKGLNVHEDDTCAKCVCSLYLSPGNQL